MKLEILGGTRRGRAAVQRRERRSEFSKEKHQAKYKWRERGTVTSLMIGRVLFGVQVRKYLCSACMYVCTVPCVYVRIRVHINSAYIRECIYFMRR